MDNSFVDKIKKFIDEHLKEEFSLSQVAEDVGYSVFHLTREFKSVTGESIMEYTRKRRIFAASKELERGRSVCDVAVDYCFDTHAGFTKAFIAMFGCTPSDFQRHLQKIKNREGKIENMDIES